MIGMHQIAADCCRLSVSPCRVSSLSRMNSARQEHFGFFVFLVPTLQPDGGYASGENRPFAGQLGI